MQHFFGAWYTQTPFSLNIGIGKKTPKSFRPHVTWRAFYFFPDCVRVQRTPAIGCALLWPLIWLPDGNHSTSMLHECVSLCVCAPLIHPMSWELLWTQNTQSSLENATGAALSCVFRRRFCVQGPHHEGWIITNLLLASFLAGHSMQAFKSQPLHYYIHKRESL